MTDSRPNVLRDRDYTMLINGEWVTARSGATFSRQDPYTEEFWGGVPLADESDVDAAVTAARRAFDHGGWPRTLPAERARLLRRLAGAHAAEQHATEGR